jgi:hypothetical protein
MSIEPSFSQRVHQSSAYLQGQQVMGHIQNYQGIQQLQQVQQSSHLRNTLGNSPGTLTYHPPLPQSIKPIKRSFMNSLKTYLENHKNIIFTIILALLADHFVFGGAFRERIKGTVDKLLAKADKQIGE